MHAAVDGSSVTETDETQNAQVLQYDVSPQDVPTDNIVDEVSQDCVLQSNIDLSNSEYDFTLQPFAIELFCGSAGLTACVRTLMPSSFGVDHSVQS